MLEILVFNRLKQGITYSNSLFLHKEHWIETTYKVYFLLVKVSKTVLQLQRFTVFIVVSFQGIFGHVFFKEVFSLHWYIGICLMLVGFYIIHKNRGDIDKKETDEYDLNDKEKKE